MSNSEPIPTDPLDRKLLTISVATLGVVYGDIGTSPLYAVRECFHGIHPVTTTPANILGILSLVFWALTLVISIKYLLFLMRADNRGEGGSWHFWHSSRLHATSPSSCDASSSHSDFSEPPSSMETGLSHQPSLF